MATTAVAAAETASIGRETSPQRTRNVSTLVIFITSFREGTASHGVCFRDRLQPVDCNYRTPSADGRSFKIGYHVATLLYGVTPAGGASMVIETYSFERASTGTLVVLDGSSFLLAAVGGPIYVLLSGFFLEAAAMVVVTALIAGGAALAIVATIGLV